MNLDNCTDWIMVFFVAFMIAGLGMITYTCVHQTDIAENNVVCDLDDYGTEICLVSYDLPDGFFMTDFTVTGIVSIDGHAYVFNILYDWNGTAKSIVVADYAATLVEE